MTWGMNDNAANSALHAVLQLNKATDTANQTELFGNVTANVYHTYETIGQFAIDANEMTVLAANGSAHPAHAGWSLRTVGQGGRAGRITYETLAVISTFVGDAENTVTPDVVITISSQPSSNSIGVGNAVNFIVVAGTTPTGRTITYKWQRDGGPGSQTWVDIANTGVFASANSNNSPTLSIANNITLSGNNFRCILTVSGGPTVHTTNALLTIV